MTDLVFLQFIPERIQTLWVEAVDIWIQGGWAMIGIAVISFVMFAIGIQIQMRLGGKGFVFLKETTWRQWLDHPELRRGKLGEILDFVTGGSTIEDTAVFFDELRSTELGPFKRDLTVMKICVNAAPLVGLLGTVTGMLSTFAALSSGAGGDKTMGLIAEGISEALITTETGLVVGLAGLFFQYHLARKYERYHAFIAHLETVISQKLYKQTHRDEEIAA
ncbi:MAG: MotA/TolQ/ExbB proton channel family protein [Candidatus Omnitrophica bacterium]|nr:MotA/TolQ/ExbB proton channel family protein [Candidatus Omnitrophota bacterium]MCA9441020.1 MotA/TolQ/ExbB proton channel family protein [Candidatus Omnitrophota bacterium]